jgi:hypothetical protein
VSDPDSSFTVGRSLGAAGRRYPVKGGYYIREGERVSGETIARGREIREVDRLVRDYGGTKTGWRKMKGDTVIVRDADGVEFRAEVHWYEHHGVGRVDFKPKRFT